MVQLYFWISVVIGLVVIIDGLMLRQAWGNCAANPLVMITSAIELIWALVSAVALFALDFPSWTILIPAIYLTHNLLGWAWGVNLVSKNKDVHKPQILIVPIWYIYIGIAIGLFISLASLLATQL